MTRLLSAVAVAALVGFAGSAGAQTVLRISEGNTAELDPQKAVIVADSILMYNVYDTLVFPSLDGKSKEMKPHLAEKIEANADGLTYTITLKPNVKFHSGNVMSADDVVFSMKRTLALNTGFAYLFTGWVDSVSAPNPTTVSVKLTKPYTSFIVSLTRLYITDSKLVMSKKEAGNYGEFGDYGSKFLNTNEAGTGAYQVTYHKNDERTEMKKFDGYFLGVPKKAPDVVRMTYGEIDPTVLTKIQRGETDLVRSFIATETKVAMTSAKGVTLASEPGLAQFFVKVNTTKPPVDDVFCRRALAFAVDYETMHAIENVGNVRGAVPSKGPLLLSMPGYNESSPAFAKRDMEKAKAELAKCKYKPGDHTLQITWIADVAKEERFALMMQQNWAELGFKSEIQRLPWTLFTQQVAKAETSPMFAQVYTFARTPDPDAYLYNIYHSSRHGQFSASEYFKDAEVDSLLDKGRGMAVGPERDELYRKASVRIVELQPSFFGSQVINTYPKRDVVSIPTLEDPKLNTGLMGGNHMFRLMEMKGS
ncbi:MAG: ABC transporter substrate-binding protein [Rhodospirillales bacterium]|nr:ABC transporter substrate-binding protein [Rhodospirillales bacterium]